MNKCILHMYIILYIDVLSTLLLPPAHHHFLMCIMWYKVTGSKAVPLWVWTALLQHLLCPIFAVLATKSQLVIWKFCQCSVKGTTYQTKAAQPQPLSFHNSPVTLTTFRIINVSLCVDKCHSTMCQKYSIIYRHIICAIAVSVLLIGLFYCCFLIPQRWY